MTRALTVILAATLLLIAALDIAPPDDRASCSALVRLTVGGCP